MADTGHGATIAITDPAITLMGCPRQMTLPTWAQESIDTSCLDTNDFRQFVPSDLMDAGEIVVELVFDPTVTIDVSQFREIATVTVTWPISVSGNTTNATLVAKGFVREFTFPTMVTEELQMATLTIQLTGSDTAQDQPTFTPESI